AGRTYRVDFAPAVGLMAPPSYWLTVTGAYDVRITATYQAPPRLEASRAGGIDLTGPTGRLYQVQRSGRPESGWSNWFEVQPATARTNLAPPTVFTNFPRQFYRVWVVP
ncbi:MAG: hypothetical protein HZA90_18815, partial [Verrucomicrobia bacterium]|nr:hypothetical protein [Verrucomicrobiota bacterium]